MQMIAQLQQQLAATQKDGRAVVQQLEVERAKNANAARVAVSKAKLPTIPSFKGEVGFNVDNWLRHLKRHFEYFAGTGSFPDDASRIAYAVMYLDGSAMDWWESEPSKEGITTWEIFVERLHTRYRPMQAAVVARTRLMSLKQTKTVSAYAHLFQRELTPISDMSVADQIFFFRNGLKKEISQRVLEKDPKTLHEAMEMAVMFDTLRPGNAWVPGGSFPRSPFRVVAHVMIKMPWM